MEQLQDFESVFGSSGPFYTAEHAEAIAKHRRELQNKLFFDQLLKMMKIEQACKLYPPKSTTEMHKLYNQITKCQSAAHQRQSLVYYLKLDTSDTSENALNYAAQVGLPQKYVTLMDGFWNMDQLHFKRALDSLTAPSLIPTLTEETLNVLCEHPKSNPSLVLGYFYTVAPIIRDSEVLDKVFRCICLSSVTEAFFFAQQQGGTVHRHLFTQMVDNVLSLAGDSVKAQMAEELVGLPFNSEEEEWFQEFLSTGSGRDQAEAKDILVMRSIIKGNLEEAEKFAASAGDKPVGGLSWETLLQSARS